MFAVAAAAFALAFASSALADPVPLTPANWIEGQQCTITWTPDTTGKWNQTNIELMSGANLNMVHLTTIATVDTTSTAASTYTWTCPSVTPNAPIYFLQFSMAAAPADLIWTTRFAIADASGNTVPPEFQTQNDGKNSPVPWGNGALTDPSTATPAPAYITGESSGTSNSTVSMSMPSGSSMSMSMTMPVSVSTPSSSGMATASQDKGSSRAPLITPTVAPTAAPTKSSNGGERRSSVYGGGLAALGAAALGLFVLA